MNRTDTTFWAESGRHMDLPQFLDMTAAYQEIAHTDPAHGTAISAFLDKLPNLDV